MELWELSFRLRVPWNMQHSVGLQFWGSIQISCEFRELLCGLLLINIMELCRRDCRTRGNALSNICSTSDDHDRNK